MCLCKIAEDYTHKKIDIVNTAEEVIKKGYMTFNWSNYDDSDNFYIRDPLQILEHLTGKKWTGGKVSAPYTPKKDEYAIEYWSRDNGKTGHFAMMDKDFNSIVSSRSVNEGKIISYRVFKVVA